MLVAGMLVGGAIASQGRMIVRGRFRMRHARMRRRAFAAVVRPAGQSRERSGHRLHGKGAEEQGD